jgi:hypothetical protein
VRMSAGDRRARPNPRLRAGCGVEAVLCQELGPAVCLAVESLDDDHNATTQPRLAEFRLGRLALGRVMRQVGDDGDAERLTFPHRRFSLSHSAGTAVSVAARSARARGVGVDVELPRAIDLRSARFFLSPGEQHRFLETRGDRAAALQQLWTVKEAVFKADLENSERLLLDYEIEELYPAGGGTERWRGIARRGSSSFRFRTVVLPELVLTVALPRGNTP